MSSTAILKARIDRMITLLEKKAEPKTWVFVLEVGTDIPEDTRRKFGPHDTVIIRQTPLRFFGNDENRPGTLSA